MAALYACTKCHQRFPFEALSQGQQLCKVRGPGGVAASTSGPGKRAAPGSRGSGNAQWGLPLQIGRGRQVRPGKEPYSPCGGPACNVGVFPDPPVLAPLGWLAGVAWCLATAGGLFSDPGLRRVGTASPLACLLALHLMMRRAGAFHWARFLSSPPFRIGDPEPAGAELLLIRGLGGESLELADHLQPTGSPGRMPPPP